MEQNFLSSTFGDPGGQPPAGIPAALALAAASYLLGSVPFALILGKLRGIDIRKEGSGNIGATNLSRALGRGWGIAAFLLDFSKGFLPVLLAGSFYPPASSVGWNRVPSLLQIACGLAAILGHVFPVYLRFRGGKGVATGFGALTALVWGAALAAGAVWLGLFLATRTVSIASLAAAAAFPLATIIIFRGEPIAAALPIDLLSIFLAILILVRHRSNILRLLSGKEGKF